MQLPLTSFSQTACKPNNADTHRVRRRNLSHLSPCLGQDSQATISGDWIQVHNDDDVTYICCITDQNALGTVLFLSNGMPLLLLRQTEHGHAHLGRPEVIFLDCSGPRYQL
jgi:hypothetical protein